MAEHLEHVKIAQVGMDAAASWFQSLKVWAIGTSTASAAAAASTSTAGRRNPRQFGQLWRHVRKMVLALAADALECASCLRTLQSDCVKIGPSEERRSSMSQPVRYQLWIVAAASVIFFTNLGGAALWDMDEALYTTCAREMFQRDDWVVPWFNGQMFPEKPPLMFWTMMAGFELFGVNEFGARFFSAVFGVATALAAFHLGRILFNARVGLWTGLITASTIIFTISARAATVDSALTLAHHGWRSCCL